MTAAAAADDDVAETTYCGMMPESRNSGARIDVHC
jgi:hypothetical protein